MALSLEDFISETLTGIVGGIDKAKTKLAESGRADWVSPPISLVGQGGEIHNADVEVHREGGYSSKAHIVRFDVALHATESGGVDGGLKVAIAGVMSVGGKGEVSSEEKSISRVQFAIPLVLADLPNEEKTRRLEQKRRNEAALNQPNPDAYV